MAKENKTDRQRLYTSLLLLVVAVVFMIVATVAWFTIADRTRVNTMDMQITAGTSLRFDLDPHERFEDYIKTLKFSQIVNRIKTDLGVDMTATPLTPVTTDDCISFSYGDGKAVKAESGAYIEFTLQFMATKDMYVHLTSADGKDGTEGTLITSENVNLPKAMRISFTVAGKSCIYDPGFDGAEEKNGVRTFGLPAKDKMIYSDDNNLFFAEAYKNIPVVVHVWIEGNDELCNDELRGADYSIRLRFAGTDKDNNLLDED